MVTIANCKRNQSFSESLLELLEDWLESSRSSCDSVVTGTSFMAVSSLLMSEFSFAIFQALAIASNLRLGFADSSSGKI